MSVLGKLFGKGKPDETAMDAIPEGNFRFIALDVETANSDRSSICQIGLACVRPDGTMETFCTYIDPRVRFSAANISVHGIKPEDVMGAPLFTDVLVKLQPLLARHPIIQHSSFDRGAINAACDVEGLEHPSWRWFDSVTIARRAWPDLRGNGGHGLSNLKQVLGLDFVHHDAGEDARAAAEVVLRAEETLGKPFPEIVSPPKPKSYQPPVTMEGSASGPLFGAIAVFTGSLTCSREEAAELAARAGMTVKAGVTKKTTHLIVGDQDLTLLAGHDKSSKHRKAEELQSKGQQIVIISETEFRTMVTITEAS